MALWLASCTHLAPSTDNFYTALEQHRFHDAQQIVNRLSSAASNEEQQKDREQLEQKLVAAETQFASQSISQAKALEKQQNLQEAIDLLTENADKLSQPSEQLNQLLDTLVQKQTKHVNQQFNRTLVSEALWMLEQKSTIQQLSQQQNNSEAQQTAGQLITRQPILAQQLISMGQYFANERQWYTSDRNLTLAQQLGAELPEGLHGEVKQHLQQFRQRRQDRQNQHYRQEANQRIAKYNKSQQLADLLAARDYVEANKDTGVLDQQEKQITLLCRERFEKDMKLGDSFYTNGNYVSAQRIWKRIAPLYPDHPELNKKLERVNKVRQSLRQLKPH